MASRYSVLPRKDGGRLGTAAVSMIETANT